jgi:hypothetical protein
METAPTSTLSDFLEATRLKGHVDLDDFKRVVLTGHTPPDHERQILAEGDLSAAVQVLGRALEVNPDEAAVLRWFGQERIADFGRMTPLEIVHTGRADALCMYLDSVEAGSSG